MRNVWILVASALLAFANFVKSQDNARNLYSSRYDNLDIDTILGSSRLVNNYVDCLLSRKPCPPEGKDLKRILPEALRTKCSRCSNTQKENALKIITTLYSNYPDQYMALRERWDPSGEYHRRFEEYLRGLQFNQIGSNGIDRPVRNDFDRDQTQILLQTLILSTTTVAPTPPPSPPPAPSNALPSGPEQRPQQLAPSALITQPRPTVGALGNRFGGDDPSTSRPTVELTTAVPSIATVRPTSRPVVRQTTSRIVTSRPTPNRFQFETAPAVAVPVFRPQQQPIQAQVQVFAQPPQTQPQPQPLAPALLVPSQIQATSSSFAVGGSSGGGSVLTTPNNIIDNFFIPPGQGGGLAANPNAGPIVGLFSQLGNKLATTADAIAGMLKRTVDVIVTSHIQAHQKRRSVGSN
ncbi:cyclin-dependent kinase inhibitor 1C-like isoform X6 [Armigeres subalbatus]|uniref:cyclin-dependent kinase inhibitor 1C-like isoform X6 n=1 Tax=Armigeres subalbatus TaxID=124917 RepID=UPI002ED166D2